MFGLVLYTDYQITAGCHQIPSGFITKIKSICEDLFSLNAFVGRAAYHLEDCEQENIAILRSLNISCKLLSYLHMCHSRANVT